MCFGQIVVAQCKLFSIPSSLARRLAASACEMANNFLWEYRWLAAARKEQTVVASLMQWSRLALPSGLRCWGLYILLQECHFEATQAPARYLIAGVQICW